MPRGRGRSPRVDRLAPGREGEPRSGSPKASPGVSRNAGHLAPPSVLSGAEVAAVLKQSSRDGALKVGARQRRLSSRSAVPPVPAAELRAAATSAPPDRWRFFASGLGVVTTDGPERRVEARRLGAHRASPRAVPQRARLAELTVRRQTPSLRRLLPAPSREDCLRPIGTRRGPVRRAGVESTQSERHWI